MSEKSREARILLQSGSSEQAIHLLEEAMREDPADIEPRELLGIAYAAKGDYPRSIEILETAVRLRPNNASILYNLGTAYRKAVQIDKAADAFQNVLKLDPNHTSAKGALRSIRPDYEYSVPNALQPEYPSPSLSRTPTALVATPARQEISLEWGEEAIGSLAMRFVALVVDNAVVGWACVLIAIVGFGDLVRIPYLPHLVYETVMLGNWGQTAGKMLASVQVDNLDGSDITWLQALKRTALKYGFPLIVALLLEMVLPKRLHGVAKLVPLVSFGWVFTNRYKMAWHDILARTIVTRG